MPSTVVIRKVQVPYASGIIRCITHGFVETKNENIIDVYSTRSVCATCGTEVAVRSVWDDVAVLLIKYQDQQEDGFCSWQILGLNWCLTKGGFWEFSFAMSRIMPLNRLFELESCTTVAGFW